MPPVILKNSAVNAAEKTSADFSKAVLDWFDQHGRKDLPWQQPITAYRVWISEIMLQQTQVNTVIPYYQRFMQSFPDIESLANATIDQVLHHWSGLGYYARARNLHKTARIIVTQHQGKLPANVEELTSLPGIGRSTAGAICAIAYQQAAVILDGNVKRVLARHHTIAGWPGQSHTLKQLWELAERHTPKQRTDHYTQAMMDLGATICTRSKPQCSACPLNKSCKAYKMGDTQSYPGKKPKKTLPVKTTQMLLIEHDGAILLQQRPPQGIWGGLWAFPEVTLGTNPTAWCQQHTGQAAVHSDTWPAYRHTFSHFHLDITPVHLKLATKPQQIMEAGRSLWYNTTHPAEVGLAAPVSKLLATFKSNKK